MKNNDASKILFIGHGRLSRHLQHYFHLLGHDHYQVWHRSDSNSQLQELVNQSQIIYLCISDSSIEELWNERLKPLVQHQSTIVLHFSGSLTLPDLPSAHPLMSFSENLYDLETYRRIHFVLTPQNSTDAHVFFHRAFPYLQNTYSLISADQKALYHALCVMGGNFPILLWQKMRAGFEDFGIDEKAYGPYLQQILKNFLIDPEKSLTGPLIRKDHGTLEANLNALHNNSFEPVYRAFVETFQKEKVKS